MIEIFLRAKHWQLFILTFGLPMIFQMILMGSIFGSVANSNAPDHFIMFNYTKYYFPIMMIFFITVFFGWFWSVVIGLQKKIPDEAKMKLTRFKVFFFFPLFYMLFFSLFMGVMFSGIAFENNQPEPHVFGSIMAVIFPLHLFSMFCMFHTLYYVAKVFKTAELKRRVTFSDFAGEFFMIWFYPIGIWIIQPKINKMIIE